MKNFIILILIFFKTLLISAQTEVSFQKEEQAKVIVKITKEGQLYIENEKLDLKAVKLKLKEYIASQKIKSVVIVAEVGTPFKNVTNVMGVANRLKLRCILATDSKY